MTMSKANWHFSRTEFTGKVYNLLANGPIQGISICGPLRTGKTSFLKHDIAPLARANGHRVIYTNFWQRVNSPLEILLYEFDQALRAGSFLGRVKSVANHFQLKYTTTQPSDQKEEKIDLSKLKLKVPYHSLLLLLDEYCERLANDRKPTFLLFDEFQEVEKAKDSKAIIAGLRTSIDKRKSSLVAVFTSSSEEWLRLVFSDRTAPFFRFAVPIELPPMDEDFVDHQLNVFRSISRAKIEREKALEIFHRVGDNPLLFQSWLMKIAMHPSMSESEAIEATQADLAKQFGFDRTWEHLNPNQRVTARMLADPVDQIYGKRHGEFALDMTGRKPPSESAIQAAISQLFTLGIVDKRGKNWRIGDSIFENWIKNRPASEF